MTAPALVWVALGPSIDVTYRLRKLHVGGIERPEDVIQVPGGKGFNAARVAHALGAPSVAVGVVGGVGGSWLRHALAEEGVPAELVEGSEPTRTCVTLAHREPPGLTEVYPRSAAVRPREWNELADVVRRTAHPGGWVLLSGAPALGDASREGLLRVIAAARTAGAAVGVDSSGDALLTALSAGADLVKVNASEARELLCVSGRRDPGEPTRAAGALASEILSKAPGLSVAVVTDGHRPAALVARVGGRYREAVVAPPVMADPVYPVGSGDAFFAGLMTGLSQSGGADDASCWPGRGAEALLLAVAAGAANAMVPGAGRLRGEDVVSVVARLPRARWEPAQDA